MGHRALGPFREFGAFAGTLYVLHRLLRAVSLRCGLFPYELMAQSVPNEPLLPARRVQHLQFIEIGPGHPDIAMMPARDDIKRQRFEHGAMCLGAYRKGALIAYVWFCRDRYFEDEVRCTYELADPARSIFDFDLFVMPEHRMGTAFVALWHGANEFLRQRGIQHSFSRMTRFNSASRRSHARLGALRVGRVLFVQLYAVELMLATLSPFVGVTWTGSRRLRLRLEAPPALQTRAEGAGSKSLDT
jgi:hypothetical protein